VIVKKKYDARFGIQWGQFLSLGINGGIKAAVGADVFWMILPCLLLVQ
jgi:hypothetical protein